MAFALRIGKIDDVQKSLLAHGVEMSWGDIYPQALSLCSLLVDGGVDLDILQRGHKKFQDLLAAQILGKTRFSLQGGRAQREVWALIVFLENLEKPGFHWKHYADIRRGAFNKRSHPFTAKGLSQDEHWKKGSSRFLQEEFGIDPQAAVVSLLNKNPERPIQAVKDSLSGLTTLYNYWVTRITIGEEHGPKDSPGLMRPSGTPRCWILRQAPEDHHWILVFRREKFPEDWLQILQR